MDNVNTKTITLRNYKSGKDSPQSRLHGTYKYIYTTSHDKMIASELKLYRFQYYIPTHTTQHHYTHSLVPTECHGRV